jgi:hypothetical protein
MIDPKIARLLDRFIEAAGFDRWEPHVISPFTFRGEGQSEPLVLVCLCRCRDSPSGFSIESMGVPGMVFEMSIEWTNPVAVAGMRAALDEYLRDTMSTPETPWGTC